MSISNQTHNRKIAVGPMPPGLACARRSANLARRAGITLTEVLISVFVLGSGLLGLAALVPLGQYHAVQANHQDRAAACGRWVFRQFAGQTRSPQNPTGNLLDTFGWVNRAGTPVYLPGFPTPPRVVVIDPRFLAANSADGAADSFPYNAVTNVPTWSLRRVTFSDPWTGVPMRTFLANELCIWRDDILFDAANDNDRPIIVQSGAGNVNFSADGNYSWLAMVRPAEQETLPQGIFPDRNMVQPSQFVVTVIVTHNRAAVINVNEDAPSERQVQASAVGPGWFELANGSIGGAPIGKLIPNQWVMISAPQLPPAGEPAPNPPLWFHRWYKIVNAADRPNGNRAIKVAGPDWPASLVNGNSVVCTIIDGAVGVYERNMSFNVTFDNPSN